MNATPRDQRDQDLCAVVVLAGGLDGSELEERARREDAVAVGLVDRGVEAAARGRLEVDRTARSIPELAAEVALRGAELSDDGGAGPEADIEFLLDVVVDQGQLDVFVAAALAGIGVNLAEQVEVRALRVSRGLNRLASRGCLA